MVMINNKTSVSFIEIKDIPKVAKPLFELPFETHPGCGRVIFRNLAGRFSWTTKRLYGLRNPPNSPPPILGNDNGEKCDDAL